MYEIPVEECAIGIPKAELHLHIEGTLEPGLVFETAGRNRIPLKYSSVDELKAAYKFGDLKDFLKLYYECTNVLMKERDFYQLTRNYLRTAHSQNVVHTEVFFDPQAHMKRGVPFDAVFNGIYHALESAERADGISSRLIMCFLRDLPAEYAMKTLELALPYKRCCGERFVAVGLDSYEVENPPSRFKDVFDRARAEGFLTVAHAGEEGPPKYVQQALDDLKVSRIDHGNRAMEDPALVERVARERIPLTVCPLSNVKLQVVKGGMQNHPLRKMMDAGLMVTINSDDPAYFGGYLNENYMAVARALGLSRNDICTLARNSFEASFLPEEEKQKWTSRVNEYRQAN